MKDLIFKYGNKEIVSGGKTILCGIINVTPDSFSDGGRYNSVDKAFERAQYLIEQGATMLDIGGESTRPGSNYVDIEEEIRRVVPVIKKIKSKFDILISVDTWKSEVAKASIDAGVDIINDITGLLGDSNMAKIVGESKSGIIIMFNPVIARPSHLSSKIFPKFGKDDFFTKKETDDFMSYNIVDLMIKYFEKSLEVAKNNNIISQRIMLDPGIGFGLTKKENFELINKIDIIKKMGYFTFLGVSRKRFITNILKENGFEIDMNTKEGLTNLDEASSILTAIASIKGVEVLRVHEIKPHKISIGIADSVRLFQNIEDINFSSYR